MTQESPKPQLPELSEDSIRTLKFLRETNLPAFYAYVVSLRANKWPLRAISEPLGVSRSIVSIWEKKYDNTVRIPLSEKMPEAPKKEKKPSRPKFTFTEYEANNLYNLAHEAAKVRRFTDKNADSRIAASTLEELLLHYKSEGASLGQMAKACEVSRSSIAQRLRKYE